MTTQTEKEVGVPRYVPERIEPAYRDITMEQIETIVRGAGPYPNLAGLGGYEGFDLGPTAWFRTFWAMDGRLVLPEAAPLLDNPAMIAAAQRAFGAEVVRPKELILNLMGPMPVGGTHVDSPTFRGLLKADTPTWLAQVMGSSSLFERWAVRVAGGISWIYREPGSGYEYWPDGLSKPSSIEEGPFGNVAIVADNDYMFHRVGAIGRPDRYAEAEKYGRRSSLSFTEGSWFVSENDEQVVRYEAPEVRISILWRAYAFHDAADAAVYDEHTDDLDHAKVVEIFVEDLQRRGLSVAVPDDPFLDRDWAALLSKTYGFGSPG